jgi:hypothetical protein
VRLYKVEGFLGHSHADADLVRPSGFRKLNRLSSHKAMGRREFEIRRRAPS